MDANDCTNFGNCCNIGLISPEHRKGYNDNKVAIRRNKENCRRHSIANEIFVEGEEFVQTIGPKNTKILLNNSNHGWTVRAGRIMMLSNAPSTFQRWELNSTKGDKQTVYYFGIKWRGSMKYVTVNNSGRPVSLQTNDITPSGINIEKGEHENDNRAFILKHNGLNNKDTLVSVKNQNIVLLFHGNNKIIKGDISMFGSHWEIKNV